MSARKDIRPLLIRLMERVDKRECWLWRGGVTGMGYGVLTVEGKSVSVHRLSYELHIGKIPPMMVVCHRCDTPRCVNPEHLFIGTDADNIADRNSKGRHNAPAGSNHWSRRLGSTPHPTRKITDEIASSIRSDYARGLKQTEIGIKYGISQSRVSKVVHNETGW